jgi:hypothetical protein
MSASEHGRPLSDLFGGLASDVSRLFRKEIELAKAEASEKLDEVLQASQHLAIGGVLAIGAVGVFLAALVAGLAALLVAMGMGPAIANFVAAIVVTVVVGAIAWGMISRGLAALRANKLNMERTTHSLAQDASVVKESF